MRIDGTRLISIKPEMLEMLKNLEVGDTLRGRVLEAIGSSIAIRTASGQIFTAALQEGTDIPKGAFVELTVSSLADGKIYAELKSENKNAGLDEKISQLLRQLNLTVDEKNTEAAKLLIKYKLPLEKEAIVKLTGLQKSIDNLNKSSEGKIGLLLSGLNIKNTPVDVLNKIVLNWPSGQVIPDTVEASAIHAGDTPVLDAAVEAENQNMEWAVNVKTNQPVVVEDTNNETAGNVKELINAVKTSNAGISAEQSENNDPVTGEAIGKIVQENSTAIEDNKGFELLKILDKLGIEPGNEVKSFAGQVADILASIRNTDMEAITYLISKEMDATPKNIGLLIKNIENSDGISQFLDKLQERINLEDNPELSVIKESIKKVFLEPRKVENAEEVTEQLKDIVKLGERLEGYLENRVNKDPEIREALSNLKDNIDFIKSINQHNNFMQIPLMINGDTSTAKLYVFNEGKRSRTIDPNNATILVALDLKSLGHLESMIGIKGKAVNVTFRVENKSIGALLERQYHLLKGSLEEKGYSLNPIRVINLEQPFSLLSLEAIINESNPGKIHFDKRI